MLRKEAAAKGRLSWKSGKTRGATDPPGEAPSVWGPRAGRDPRNPSPSGPSPSVGARSLCWAQLQSAPSLEPSKAASLLPPTQNPTQPPLCFTPHDPYLEGGLAKFLPLPEDFWSPAAGQGLRTPPKPQIAPLLSKEPPNQDPLAKGLQAPRWEAPLWAADTGLSGRVTFCTSQSPPWTSSRASV